MEYNLKDFLDEIGRLSQENFLLKLEITRLKEKKNEDEKVEEEWYMEPRWIFN